MSPTLFLSTVSHEFGALRVRLATLLERTKRLHVRHQDDFFHHGVKTLQMLEAEVTASDVIVHVIGSEHGSCPPIDQVNDFLNRHPDFPTAFPDVTTLATAGSLSWTQWEIWIALFFQRKQNKPARCLIYELPDRWQPDSEQRRHAERLHACHAHPKTVTTDNQLYDEILLSLIGTGLLAKTDLRPIHLPCTTIGTLFKGRTEFLNQLRTSLQRAAGSSATAITGKALHGLGGVGKTRLAVEYAWQHADDYSAVLFITADSPSRLITNLAELTGPLVLNLPEQHVTEDPVKVAAALQWLSNHPGWFLILDNVDTEDAAQAVEDLLPKLHRGQVLITSRLGRWQGQVQPLELDVLSPESAAQFLLERTEPQHHSPLRGRQCTAEDSSEAIALATDLDGLALALEQAAGYIVTRRKSFAEYRQLWQQRNETVRKWYDPRIMQYPKSIATTWEATLDQLSSDEQQLLNQLAWYSAEPIPLPLFRLELEDSTQNLDAERLETAIVNLSDFSMLRWDADSDTVSVHRVVQEILRTRQPAAQTHLTTALQRLERAHPKDHPSDVRTWPAWDPLQPHIAAAVHEGHSRNIAEPTATLMCQLGGLHQARAQFHEAEPLLRNAVKLSEQHHGRDHPDVATSLNNLAGLLDTTNRLPEAEPLYRRALAIYEQSYGPDHPSVATSLNNLAGLLKSTNRLSEAEPLDRRALAIREQSYGPDHPDVAISLNNLAELLFTTNRLPEAEPLYRRALAINERSYGPDHPLVAASLNNLAGLLFTTNRLPEAEPLLRRALAIDERSYGPDHPSVATSLNNLASLLESTNRLPDAEPLYRRALAIDERSYGPDHPSVATSLNNLAALLRTTNRLPEAEPLYRRALAIYEQSYGPDHPDVAISLNNLAALLRTTNRLPEAEPLYRRALAIYEQSYGPDHPSVANSLNNLAVLLESTNRLPEAEPLHRRALAIREQSYGPDHPDVAISLNNLAELLRTTNRLPEAEPLHRRALAIREQSYGPDHPLVAASLNNLASLLESTNRLPEAEPLYRRALEIKERSYGPDHPSVATSLNNLAGLLRTTNRLPEAEPLYRRALAIHEQSYGPDHPLVATSLNNLAGLLRTTNRLPEAEPLHRRALAIDEQSYGPDHPLVATSLNNLAGLLFTTNRLPEAEPLYRRALAICEQSYGPDHPSVAASLNNLAELLRTTNRLPEAEPLYRRALAIDEQSYGPDHPSVAASLNNLAGLLRTTNRLPEAEPLYRRALAIYEQSYGPDHPDVAGSLHNLALLLFRTNRASEAERLSGRACRILEQFAEQTGHEHPNYQVVKAGYARIQSAVGDGRHDSIIWRMMSRALAMFSQVLSVTNPRRSRGRGEQTPR